MKGSPGMKLVFDTNVIVDVLARRPPFVDASKNAMATAAREGVLGAMTANTATGVFYLLRKHQPDRKALKITLIGLMDYLEVLDTTGELCRRAIRSAMTDFEDALLVESAKQWSADYIVTRNVRDFAASPIPALTPGELIGRFGG